MRVQRKHLCAAEMERLNVEALAALITRTHAQLRTFLTDSSRPRASRLRWAGRVAARSANARKAHDSKVAFRERAAAWSGISLKAVLGEDG
jgi:hypothetical protein